LHPLLEHHFDVWPLRRGCVLELFPYSGIISFSRQKNQITRGKSLSTTAPD
jgi:hypothetical protein